MSCLRQNQRYDHAKEVVEAVDVNDVELGQSSGAEGEHTRTQGRRPVAQPGREVDHLDAIVVGYRDSWVPRTQVGSQDRDLVSASGKVRGERFDSLDRPALFQVRVIDLGYLKDVHAHARCGGAGA